MRLHSDTAHVYPKFCHALVIDPVQEIPVCYLPQHKSKRCFFQTHPYCGQLVTDTLLSKGSASCHLGVHGRWHCMVDTHMYSRTQQLKMNPGSITNCTTWKATQHTCVSVSPQNTPVRMFEWINRISYINPGNSV